MQHCHSEHHQFAASGHKPLQVTKKGVLAQGVGWIPSLLLSGCISPTQGFSMR